MSSTNVLILTWALAAAVVGLYVWFVMWRLRVDRRRKDAAAEESDRMSAAIATAARLAAADEPATRPPFEPAPEARAEPVVAPAPAVVVAQAAPAKSDTVAGALSGIALPHNLTPLTMVMARPSVGDRVVFWTKHAPAETVGHALGDELERLGYEVKPLDTQTIAATRGEQRLILVIHPEGAAAKIGDQQAFSSVPDLAVVVEIWIP